MKTSIKIGCKITAVLFVLALIPSCDNKVESYKKNNITITEQEDGLSVSKFKVWGNCEMCKETIETALKVDGVAKADWDTETKIIKISYDSTKINLDHIQQKIADVGYDNVKYKGDDKAYSELPECCQYSRK